MLVSDLLENNEWEQIIADIEATQVPMDCVKKVVIEFADGSCKTFDLKQLRTAGLSENEIENSVEEYLTEYDHAISETKCVIDVNAVATKLQQQTQNILQRVEKQ